MKEKLAEKLRDIPIIALGTLEFARWMMWSAARARLSDWLHPVAKDCKRYICKGDGWREEIIATDFGEYLVEIFVGEEKEGESPLAEVVGEIQNSGRIYTDRKLTINATRTEAPLFPFKLRKFYDVLPISSEEKRQQIIQESKELSKRYSNLKFFRQDGQGYAALD